MNNNKFYMAHKELVNFCNNCQSNGKSKCKKHDTTVVILKGNYTVSIMKIFILSTPVVNVQCVGCLKVKKIAGKSVPIISIMII